MAGTLYQLDLDGRLIRSVDISGIDDLAAGIAYDGKYLWYTGNTNNKMYQLDLDGRLIRSVDPGIFGITGIAFDGKNMWGVSNPLGGDSLFLVSRDGTVIKSVDISGIDEAPYAIVRDGKTLWFTGGTNWKIYQLDLDGTLIRSFDTGDVSGIAFDGKNLYWTIWEAPPTPAYIYVGDREGNVIRTIDLSAVTGQPNDITIVGKHIYMVARA